MTDTAALKTRANALLPRLRDFARDLYDHPELGYREFYALSAFRRELSREGLEIETGIGGIPTAFRAQLGTAGSGPQVAIVAEFDALPGVGHGCGHNIIAASALGAFLTLAPAFSGAARTEGDAGGAAGAAGAEGAGGTDDRTAGASGAGTTGLGGRADTALTGQASLPGGVTLIGTPAEEGGGGKELLVQKGIFDGFDAALMIHPGNVDIAAAPSSAKRHVIATFTGRTAHAAANPHLGRNALDGAVTAYQAIAQLRQHIKASDKIHGIFLEGGTRPNIVPERAVLEYFLRAASIEDLLSLSDRAEAAFKGGALASGVEVEVTWDGEPIYLPFRVNAPLAESFARHLAGARQIQPVTEKVDAASSDIGNVSHLLPTLEASVAIGDPNIPGHSRERAESTLTPDGDRAIADSSFGLAATAADVLTDAEFREQAQADFAAGGKPVRVSDLVPLGPWPTFPDPPADLA